MNEDICIWNILFFVYLSHLLHLKWMIFCCWSWLILFRFKGRYISKPNRACMFFVELFGACVSKLFTYIPYGSDCFPFMLSCSHAVAKNKIERKTPCTTQCDTTHTIYFVVVFFFRIAMHIEYGHLTIEIHRN